MEVEAIIFSISDRKVYLIWDFGFEHITIHTN